jgi:hypothetical protein
MKEMKIEEFKKIVDSFDDEESQQYTGEEAFGESHLKIPSKYKELLLLAIKEKKSFFLITHTDHDSYMEFNWSTDEEAGHVIIWNEGIRTGVVDGLQEESDLEKIEFI